MSELIDDSTGLAELACETAATTSANDAASFWSRLMPWLAGSGIAMGQAALATACSLPTVGKCVGCGSCVVGVASLSSWAVARRKHQRALAEQGLEPFEVRSEAGSSNSIES